MGYHKREIKKGKLGTVSKIREELEELEDALDQGNRIMALCELSDLYGAIEALTSNMGMTMEDLSIMSDATKRAFRTGRRVSACKE